MQTRIEKRTISASVEREVEGSLGLQDAVLHAKVGADVRARPGGADLSFLPVLERAGGAAVGVVDAGGLGVARLLAERHDGTPAGVGDAGERRGVHGVPVRHQVDVALQLCRAEQGARTRRRGANGTSRRTVILSGPLVHLAKGCGGGRIGGAVRVRSGWHPAREIQRRREVILKLALDIVHLPAGDDRDFVVWPRAGVVYGAVRGR